MPEPMESFNLNDFFNLIYANEEGYVYLATKDLADEAWHKFFFSWPDDKEEIAKFIREKTVSYEVYYSPALWKDKGDAHKEHVKGARVFWVEFDGHLPTEKQLQDIPDPSIRLCSSVEGHQHWYWKTDELIHPLDLEKINRSLAYHLGADSSGWDAGQVLRPIETNNHKRSAQVTLVGLNGLVTTVEDFGLLPPPPPPVDVPEPTSVPSIEDVIARYKWAGHTWKLFKAKIEETQDRSAALMRLAYECAEMGLLDEEIFAVVLNADNRWGKYRGRTDQIKRLAEIVTRARAKIPTPDQSDSEQPLISMGFKTVLAQTVKLEWVWEGLLQKAGNFLLTGPSGVGKTQFSLDAAANIVLGRNFLELSTNPEQKIGFFSLEMGLVDLKYFLGWQAQGFTEKELELLEQNLRFFPLGEPIYLNRDEEKKRVEAVIEREGLTGIIIDSLGSATGEDLSEETKIKGLMDWNDSLRARTGVFTWYIHHHRKATGDNRRPNKLADVYGSQYITARATSVVALWDSGILNTIQLLPLKLRLAPKPSSFNIFRNSKLQFTKKSEMAILETQPSSDELAPKESEPVEFEYESEEPTPGIKNPDGTSWGDT